MTAVVVQCPCKGKYTSRKWHTSRGLSPCIVVSDREFEEWLDRQKPRPPSESGKNTLIWVPGTSIYVPEIEEL